MKHVKRVALVATILALSAVIVFAGAALAQGPGPANRAAPGAASNRHGRGGHGQESGYGLAVKGAWGGSEHSLVAVAAELFDMEQADLVAELQGGKTLAEVAETKNIAVQDLVDAFLAPRAEYLAQAVADGKITQADVDAMQAHMTDELTEKLAHSWEARGNGMCDGTCTEQPGQRMRGGQRHDRGMAGQRLQRPQMSQGMGGRWY
jgi:hypothetical protein